MASCLELSESCPEYIWGLSGSCLGAELTGACLCTNAIITSQAKTSRSGYGLLCHMLAKFKSKRHRDMQDCAQTLKTAAQCMCAHEMCNSTDRRLAGPDRE